jgi:hypothetical protein
MTVVESCTSRRPLLLLLAGSFICATSARADDTRWLFVPVLVGNPASDQNPTAFAESLERAVGAERDIEPNRAAATRFEAVHSSEPARVSDEQLDRLLQIVGDGIRSLAFGKRAKAQGELQSIENLTGPVRDYLQRAPERAQLLFDACALKSQLLLREKQNEQAQQQMIQCVRTWPGYKPGRAAPGSRKLFDTALSTLEEEPHGTLTIQGRRAGCTVRVNGIELGTSPAKLRVSPGYARVQLECDSKSPGRIHAVSVGTTAATLVIDEVFDAAVHTDGSLWLGYPDEATRAERMDADAEAVARVSEAGHLVMLVVDAAAERVTLRTKGRDVVSTPVTAGNSPTALAELVDKLLATAPKPRSEAHVAAVPVQSRAEPAPVNFVDSDQSESDVPLVVGVTVAAVGAIGLATGWALYAERYSVRNKLYFGDVSYSSLDRFDSLAPWMLVTAGLGASLIAAAEPLFLTDAEDVPAAAWVVGGAGAALAVAGLAFGQAGSHCQPRASSPCDGFGSDALFGPMLALHAVPLVSVPLIYLVRSWSGSTSLALSVSGSSITLRGAY